MNIVDAINGKNAISGIKSVRTISGINSVKGIRSINNTRDINDIYIIYNPNGINWNGSAAYMVLREGFRMPRHSA